MDKMHTLLKENTYGIGGWSRSRQKSSVGGGVGSYGSGKSGTRDVDPRSVFSKSDNRWERIGNGRYWLANDALIRSGSSEEEADTLARILAAQSALEAGWVDTVKGNNYAGYMSNGKRMSFASPDEFWDYHIRNLDEKWPGWRNSDSVDSYYDIVNNTGLGLDTKEKHMEYNKTHRDAPAYIYAPVWENENYLGRLRNVYDNYISEYVPEREFAKGGSIHIKPENRGKFTETKKRTGKTTEELTHSKNPLTRKRAIFAQNAKKWKHEDGGIIDRLVSAYGSREDALAAIRKLKGV